MEYDYSDEIPDMEWRGILVAIVAVGLAFLVFKIMLPTKEAIGRILNKVFGPTKIEI